MGGIWAYGSILPTLQILLHIMINRIKSYFEKGDERTKNIKVNVLQSFIYKGLSIVLSLLIVPFTIGFVNAEQYGIWLTISSIAVSYTHLTLPTT